MIEYLDVLNPDGSPTGESLSRDQVHEGGHWHRTVHVWIVNSQHEVLLQKRSEKVVVNPGLWDISSAGHIPAGEASRAAALRELQEELGVDVKEDQLEFLFSQQSTIHSAGHLDNAYNDVYLLRLNIDIANLVLQETEVSAVKWVDACGFKNFIGDRSMVEHNDEYLKLHEILNNDKQENKT